MLGVVSSLAGLIKIRSSSTKVDDSTFRLHYRWTTSLFFLACALVAASDLIGGTIHCMNGNQAAEPPVVTYCWVMSTFTINTTHISSGIHEGPYHGQGSNFSGVGTEDKNVHERRVHSYYQWVPIVLFLVGCLFYLPHALWKEIEGKRVDCLLQGLNIISNDESTPTKKKNIVNYILESKGRLNGKYAYGYLIMQVLNLFNVLLIMFLLEEFFGGVFMDYGHRAVQYWNGHIEIEHSPLITAFPRLAKCSYKYYGGSGGLQDLDAFCLLPQNILNEKLFIFFWFWLVLLLTLTCIRVIYIAALLASPFLRVKRIEKSGKVVSSLKLQALVNQLEIGDYFLLMSIGKNVDALCFRDILQELIKSVVPDVNETSGRMFSPNAPSYRHFDLDEEDPIELKRRMETADTSV